jgi:hypothetical protein
MICPKCGFQQDGGSECLHCGLIFLRYHGASAFRLPESAPNQNSDKPRKGHFRSFLKIFRWITLGLAIVAILLILVSSPPPRIPVNPDDAQRAEAKVLDFRSSVERGAEARLELDEPELNGWLSDNLALGQAHQPVDAPAPKTAESLIALAKKAAGSQSLDSSSLEQVQSSVRDIKIELLEDSLLLYAIFDMHGMDLSLQLEGKLMVQDGCLRLEPTSGKLGSFPLMAGTLQAVAKRLFDSPQNREKFRVPPQIRDVRIQNGQLIVTSR